jgi:predicted dehydrogenase
MTRSLVIGGGSIGTRHGRLLAALGSEVRFVSRRQDLPEAAFTDIRQAISDFLPDYVVVANETSGHERAVKELVTSGFSGKVLCEKPLAVSPETLAENRFSFAGVAFNLRFHPVLVELERTLEGHKPLSVEIYAGQELSTWRPTRSIAEQYSAHAHEGGGVLRDLSHELDYAQMLFGPITGVFGRGGRVGTVTVDSDDSWAIIASLRDAPQASIQLNYLDRPGARFIRVVCQEMTVHADVLAGQMTVAGEVRTFETPADSSYTKMHLDVLHENGLRTASLAQAFETDSVIRDIELSAQTNEWISR